MSNKTLILAFSLLCSGSLMAGDLDLEPCINGGVSSSGSFPTQDMEDQIHAYLKWRSDAPYHLFRVASKLIETPYPEE